MLESVPTKKLHTYVENHSHSYERIPANASFVSTPHFRIKLNFSVSVPYYLVSSALSVDAFTFPFPQLNNLGIAPSHIILFLCFSASRRLAFPALNFCFFGFSDAHRFFPSLCNLPVSFSWPIQTSTYLSSLLGFLLEIPDK